MAKGYIQTHGIDYDETFVSLAKMMTVRMVLTVIVAKGWDLHQMDVKMRFFKEILENRST